MKSSSRASPGSASAHGPGNPSTAAKAVGYPAGSWRPGPPGPRSARRGRGCAPRSARCPPGVELADQHEQPEYRGLVDPRLVADRGAPRPVRPRRARRRRRSHVSRARAAVEQTTASGTYPDAPSQRPITGASRLPRLASGRSWSATSGQSDLACRSRTSRLPDSPRAPPALTAASRSPHHGNAACDLWLRPAGLDPRALPGRDQRLGS